MILDICVEFFRVCFVIHSDWKKGVFLFYSYDKWKISVFCFYLKDYILYLSWNKVYIDNKSFCFAMQYTTHTIFNSLSRSCLFKRWSNPLWISFDIIKYTTMEKWSYWYFSLITQTVKWYSRKGWTISIIIVFQNCKQYFLSYYWKISMFLSPVVKKFSNIRFCAYL